MSENLQGQIEKIIFRNEENGYTVAEVSIAGKKEPATVVGTFMSVSPGESFQMQGEWTNHPKFGEQFKISRYESEAPATVHGIEKYLGSGLIRGIGEVMAKRIVEKFGSETLAVIGKNINRLTEVEGIGPGKLAMIRASWEDQRDIREVMLFLQEHEVTTGCATKIFRHYGKESLRIVRENPYRLAADIFGIGFLTADRIAEKLGIARNSPQRIVAGILFVLKELSGEGHAYYPCEQCAQRCKEILKVEGEEMSSAFAALAADKRIVVEDLCENELASGGTFKAVYLARYHICQTGAAQLLRNLMACKKSLSDINAEKSIRWVQERMSITLAKKQQEAVAQALKQKVMVITGGPGTGKTTIIQAILKIAARPGVRILLSAPTGRAAKRMMETTGFEAKTIHRLLKYSVQGGGFEKNEQNPLECDLLVIDEASMIDIVLMYHLLKAVPHRATLVLVGDVNQLPSVGPGNVLKDIIDSGAVPVVELNEIFRQARESMIIVNAHGINSGRMPDIESSKEKLEDFYFIEKEDPEEVLKLIIKLVTERIPARFGFNPVDDIQVLTPMHKGVVGTKNLNAALQDVLNPGKAVLTRGAQGLRLHDKVMQVKNNYDKEVFNGDIGRITGIDTEKQRVTISFDGTPVLYEFTELDEIELSYAISVHKAQGSEFSAVVMPVLTQHYMLLQRNLIYTAVTRGKKLMVLVGTRKALAIAVKNDRPRKRYTRLKYRLQ